MASPALAVLYTGCALSGRNAWISIILMMSPRCFAKLGAAACERNNVGFQVAGPEILHCGSVICRPASGKNSMHVD